jgi:hypothetical protein
VGCGLRIGAAGGADRGPIKKPCEPRSAPIRDRPEYDGDETLRSGVQNHRCFVMLGGLRYNRCDLMKMKCGCNYFRVIFQRVHKFPEFIN